MKYSNICFYALLNLSLTSKPFTETTCYNFNNTESETHPTYQTKNITCNPNASCEQIKFKQLKAYPKKNTTLMFFGAADNDLHYFIWNNIKQLAKGANEYMHIVVQINEPGVNKKTQRYLIEKNKAILLNKDNNVKLNSGDPQTLYDFCEYSIKTFPADNYILDLSNHGSGTIDRKITKLANPTGLFHLNPNNLKLELDRSIEYLEFLQDQTGVAYRGICYDETHHSYITNKQLQTTLERVCDNCLDGRPLSMIWMDACLMASLEIAIHLKNCCEIMIASQEVVLGPGLRYDKALRPFCNGNCLSQNEFATHIIKCYEETYANITNEYTLSAIRLNQIENLENNVDQVGQLLAICAQNQLNGSVTKTIKICTKNIGFEEPSYRDLAAFYKNLMTHIKDLQISQNNDDLKNKLLEKLDEGLRLIQKAVIENVAGNNVSYAKGISIYLPDPSKGIHHSYINSDFAKTNNWATFISSLF